MCVSMTRHGSKVHSAHRIQHLVDLRYPYAEWIRLVSNKPFHLHVSSSLEGFRSSDARRLVGRLETHYIAGHCSWLNVAEMQLGTLSWSSLDLGSQNIKTLHAEVEPCYERRNAGGGKSDVVVCASQAWREGCEHGDECLDPVRSQSVVSRPVA